MKILVIFFCASLGTVLGACVKNNVLCGIEGELNYIIDDTKAQVSKMNNSINELADTLIEMLNVDKVEIQSWDIAFERDLEAKFDELGPMYKPYLEYNVIDTAFKAAQLSFMFCSTKETNYFGAWSYKLRTEFKIILLPALEELMQIYERCFGQNMNVQADGCDFDTIKKQIINFQDTKLKVVTDTFEKISQNEFLKIKQTLQGCSGIYKENLTTELETTLMRLKAIEPKC